MAEWLESSPFGMNIPGSKQLVHRFFKKSHPARNGYPNLFSAGEPEGYEEEEWHPTS